MKTLALLVILGIVLVSTTDIPRLLQRGRGRGRGRRRPDECNADGTCDGDREVCITLYNICHRVQCTDDTHCDAPKECRDYRCRDKACAADADCGDTTLYFCHPDRTECREKRCNVATAATDCTNLNYPECNPTYFYCQGASCTSDGNCPTDFFCNGDQICARAYCTVTPTDNCSATDYQCDSATRRCVRTPCTAANEATVCGTGKFCHIASGRCRYSECTSDADCTNANRPHCDTDNHKCTKAPCTSDADCPTGRTCDNGNCRRACTVDADCNNGNAVCTNGACVAKDCASDQDCTGSPPRCDLNGKCKLWGRRRGHH